MDPFLEVKKPTDPITGTSMLTHASVTSRSLGPCWSRWPGAQRGDMAGMVGENPWFYWGLEGKSGKFDSKNDLKVGEFLVMSLYS